MPDAARLGNPSFVWRAGQQRRFDLVAQHAHLPEQTIVDLGCGLGEYVRAFERSGAHAFGTDIASSRLLEARSRGGGTSRAEYAVAAGETLPFADGSIDVIFMNEVIEHVADDHQTVREIDRVLRPGGRCIMYAPNRLYPFETHGIYLRKRYIFGNIPLVNWLPDVFRRRLVPHARAYRHGDWARLAKGTRLRIVEHGYVYPGFDNIAARSRRLAAVVRRVCYWAERNPLRRFGLSHFVVYERPADGWSA